jgi:hypothetical protein
MHWTKTEIEHPSGERFYVSIREDGKRIRVVSYNAALRVMDLSSRKAATPPDFPGHVGHSIITAEWDNSAWPWREAEEAEDAAELESDSKSVGTAVPTPPAR